MYVTNLLHNIGKSKDLGFLTKEAKSDIEKIGKTIADAFSFMDSYLKKSCFESGLANCFKNWNSFDEKKDGVNAYRYFSTLFKAGMALPPNNEYSRYLAEDRKNKLSKID